MNPKGLGILYCLTQSCGYALHWAKKRDAQSALGHFHVYGGEIILKAEISKFLVIFSHK
jgi:hypothetical protein